MGGERWEKSKFPISPAAAEALSAASLCTQTMSHKVWWRQRKLSMVQRLRSQWASLFRERERERFDPTISILSCPGVTHLHF